MVDRNGDDDGACLDSKNLPSLCLCSVFSFVKIPSVVFHLRKPRKYT